MVSARRGLGFCVSGWSLTGLALACSSEVPLFEFVSGSGSSGGAGGAGRSDGTEGEPGSGGLPMDDQGPAEQPPVTALRLVIHDKVPGDLGVQFRTLAFGLADGGSFPPTEASAQTGIDFEQSAGNDSDPALPFDGDPETWWELRLDPQEGYVGLRSLTPLDSELATLFVDLHQHQFRAPTDFDVLAFDGVRWWTVIAVRGLDWPEATDGTQWEADQRVFSLPPPRDWRPVE